MVRPLPTVLLEWLFPGIEREPISIRDYEYKIGNMPLTDLAHLCHLARRLDPRLIFEIGTFEGLTTLQLALNCRADVLTLDLPPEAARQVADEGLDVYPERVGQRFADAAVAGRIRQLFGDSQTFDFSPWYGQVDLVFVDASHHYEHVLKDTETALRLVSPRGMIAWHDYASWAPGVVHALEVTLENVPLVHLSETSLAVYFADREKTNRWQFEWVRKDLLTEMEASLQRLQGGCQELEASYQRLQAQFDEAVGEHQEFQELFNQLQEDHRRLQDRLHDVNKRRDDLQRRLKEAEAERDELARRCAELEVGAKR